MRKRRPDPWSEWYKYYDARPVPFPRRCKCCKKIVRNERESGKHVIECLCVTTLRIYPPYLDSDRWERIKGYNYNRVRAP